MSEDYVRIYDVVMSYWDVLRAGRKFPCESEINPDDLKRVWDNCFLLQITPDQQLKYDYLGKNLIPTMDGHYTQQDWDTFLCPQGGLIAKKFWKVVENQEAMTDEGEFMNSEGMVIKFREFMAPLGRDGVVTHVLGGLRWKAF